MFWKENIQNASEEKSWFVVSCAGDASIAQGAKQIHDYRLQELIVVFDVNMGDIARNAPILIKWMWVWKWHGLMTGSDESKWDPLSLVPCLIYIISTRLSFRFEPIHCYLKKKTRRKNTKKVNHLEKPPFHEGWCDNLPPMVIIISKSNK